MNCGTGLDTGQATAAGPTAGFILERHIPRELLAKLESARIHGGKAGERRVITILFCDVKGSTAAAEQLDPEEWTEIMNGAFECMIRPIYKYEGIVPRLMGDAILAFFGAPIAHEDDPQRAVLAALDIQANIGPYSERIRERYGISVGVRVGINTGLVVVGEIGSDLRLEYTAIGDAINLAARMEQTAEPGMIQISEETHKLVAPLFDTESLGEMQIKGKSAPVQTYRVLAAKGIPRRLRGIEGLSSPLVGRETELGVLNARLQALHRNRGAFVTVIGEAGLGKTSLIAEIRKQVHEGAQIKWLEGQALSYAQSVSYFAWRQVIRQSIDARENDTPLQVREKLHAATSARALPEGDTVFLETLLAVEDEQSLQEVSRYQGEARVQRMTEAMRAYLCSLARESPLVVVLDDLHWMDVTSLDLFFNLVEVIDQYPVLFLGLLRPDREAASWEFMEKASRRLNGGFHQIILEPLSPEKTSTLLINLLGLQELPRETFNMIMEKAEGNPFFVEEVIRSLIETKQIVRQNNHWLVVGEVSKLSLPNTLTGVLGARIDRLPEETRRILQIASVIGRSFDRRVLASMTGSGPDLDVHILKLEQSGLVQPDQADAESAFIFKHALVQDAAYNSILLKQRRELHGRVGEILEAAQGDRSEELAPLLAHHFHAAEDPRSMKYDTMAGDAAERLYANAEAAIHYGRAVETGRRIQADASQIGDLFAKCGKALEQCGRYDQALRTYEDMRSFAHERGNSGIEISALTALATVYSTFTSVHNPTLADEMLKEALELARRIGDRDTQTKLHWNLMLNYLFSKRLDQSLVHSELALALARESDNRENLAFVLNDLCRLHTCRGEFDKAHTVIKEARELWRSLDNQVMLADSLGSEAEAYYNACEYDKGLELLLQALSISEKIENLWGQCYDRMLISFIYFQTGQIGHGIQMAEQSVTLGEEAGLIASNSLRSELAWMYAYCGAFEKGFHVIGRAMRFAEANQPAWITFPQAAKVRMHLLQGDLKSAGQTAGNALLEPISIPYARYTIFLCLANIELAAARGDHQRALTLVDDLLNEVSSQTRVDIPEALRWKAISLLGLNRPDEAQHVLDQARSLASASGSKLHLWPILAEMAEVNSRLGNLENAEVNRLEARRVIGQIVESLREIGLSESFLSQPRVQALMG